SVNAFAGSLLQPVFGNLHNQVQIDWLAQVQADYPDWDHMSRTVASVSIIGPLGLMSLAERF
ncbi:hypothetical protein N9L79_07075, partial [Alphaproteobacteria bacterium]|nr:hypothetical protein [Alphaproteobacteria bacterium]